MCKWMGQGMRAYLALTNFLSPLVWLAARLWIARVFFYSGLTKIHDWSSTLYLFENEYHVPLLPIPVAAFSAALFELSCPVLLVLGFGTRLAALPLLAMTAVIQFTYDQNIEHLYWALLLGLLLTNGPGKLSVDHWVRRRWMGQ
ncbi:MAG: DoxX family protein [Alphaproteobacteria bacterium]|nr:DoxX family protein [Alphaproteobacteria bacterium]